MLSRPNVLVLSLPPIEHATRTRKAAALYAAHGPVTFLAPQGVGRTGKWGQSGSFTRDGITVHQVPVSPPSGAPTRVSQAVNLGRSYLPAFARLLRAVLNTPAEVVHVTGVPLLPLAFLHQWRHRSTLVLDVNERPASVSASGSLFSVFARIEPALLRRAARRAAVTTVVTPGHADILRERFGFTDVLVVRNAPLQAWRAAYVAPPAREAGEPLRVVTVGTIFEGRGYEALVDGVALARANGSDVSVEIWGGGRADYLATLTARAEAAGVADAVVFAGRVPGSEVSATYLRGHLGLAFYEAADAGNDSLSNKILECVSTGRAVLAGDLPENRRFIEANDVGWLCPVDAPGIADGLAAAARATDLGDVAKRARQLGDTELTWEVGFTQVLDRLGMTTTDGGDL